MANDIDTRRSEYEKSAPKWQLVNDMVESENLGDHLITLNPTDLSVDNQLRNVQYKKRASWLGVSGFTLAGLIGTAFAKMVKIELPSSLDYLLKNADGSGVGLAQKMQRSTGEVLKNGRDGLFVTFPDTNGEPVSRADMDALKYVATIHEIDALRIINWDEIQVGAEVVISLVVFTDTVKVRDGYGITKTDARRELALEDGVFVDRMWVKTKDGWSVHSETHPRDASGSLWSRIPFKFIGSVDNNSSIDKGPMYDVATKNRDHYRNSADNEESVWFCGQAQPWATGLTAESMEQMKAAGLYIGSRNMLGLPEGATFAYAAAPANTMVRQAMLDKVEEMASIGARMIKPGTVAKTATQASGEATVQHSILSLAATNVEAAYISAVGFAQDYMGGSGEAMIEINREFMTRPITAQDITTFKDLVLSGIIGDVDAHRYLTRHDLIDPEKTFDEYSGELESRENVVMT